MATLSEKLQVIIEALGGSATINEFEKIGRAAQKAYGDTSSGAKEAAAGTGIFDRAATSISGKLKTLGVDANVTGGMLKTGIALGATAAGAAALKFGADSVHAFADATSSVRAFQRVSGATAEDSSKLVAAMKQLGIDSDAGATSVFRLSRNIADHADKLAADNIQIKKNADGNTDVVGTLLNVADAYNATQDPAQKAKIVFDAFGRSGAQMIPILQRGRDGLKELFAEADKSHEIFSQADLEKGRQFSLATAQLGEAVKGVEIEVGSGLVPALTKAATGLTDLIHLADQATGPLGGLGDVISTLTKYIPGLGGLTAASDLAKGHFQNAAVDITGFAGLAAHALFGLGDSAGSAKDKQAALASATEESAKAANSAAEANAAEEKAIDGVINASIAAVNSTLGLERATSSEVDAVNIYNEKLAANTAASGQNADAAKALRTATLDAKDSMVNEASAAVKLAQDQAQAAGQTLSASDAARIFHDKMIELANTVGGPLHDQLINLANTIIYSIPDSKEIVVSIDASGLQGQINYVNQVLGGIAPPDRSFGVGAHFRAEGGIVTGPELAVIGEAGPELILPMSKPARMVELLGQAGLVKSFDSPSLAGGGGGRTGGGGSVTVNFPNYLGSKEEVTEAVFRALTKAGGRYSALRN